MFGEPETPPPQRLPERQLSDVTLTVHGATWNAERSVVRMHAEATTAFSDGTTGEGVRVGFFLNGRKLTELPTDDFGLALVEQEFPAEQFIPGQNTLVLRVKGFACHGTQTFSAEPSSGLSHRLPAPIVKVQPVADQLEEAMRLVKYVSNQLARLTVFQEMPRNRLLNQSRELQRETNGLITLLKEMGNPHH